MPSKEAYILTYGTSEHVTYYGKRDLSGMLKSGSSDEIIMDYPSILM